MLVKIAKYFNVSTDFLLDLNKNNLINTDGLNDKEIAHIKMMVQDLLARSNPDNE